MFLQICKPLTEFGNSSFMQAFVSIVAVTDKYIALFGRKKI